MFQGDFQPYYNLAVLEKSVNKDDAKAQQRAKALLGEALERNPLESVIHYQLMLIALKDQDIEGFKFHAREFLRLDPDHAKASDFSGVLVKDLGIKGLQLRKGGWMTAEEEKAWKPANAFWTKAFPLGEAKKYEMSYRSTNLWTAFTGDISITLKSVTVRGGVPVGHVFCYPSSMSPID